LFSDSLSTMMGSSVIQGLSYHSLTLSSIRNRSREGCDSLSSVHLHGYMAPSLRSRPERHVLVVLLYKDQRSLWDYVVGCVLSPSNSGMTGIVAICLATR
jgi:hypothetical protein